VAEDLRDFLNDEFLTILSEPLVRKRPTVHWIGEIPIC
jgi:hypothetical protein